MRTPIQHIDLGPLPAALPDEPATTGLGDLVAMVAQPIARAIDGVAGTHVAQCGACAQRHAALNSAIPDIRHPLSR